MYDFSGTVCIDPECIEMTEFESEGGPVQKKPKITALDKSNPKTAQL